ncbi:Zinc phosphodiesterase ELAC protein 1 [Hondaea fermentalgiana]|uniref:Zinc phosphodiesterase ELAC protein 1 n=1 Tax=Hondaea fermentalgiana TaxID=2315210 RepID=A0A2R5GQA3_9STRA|nr:Zinc phosphodiesterase ELAC protein 1 [Hondaea fermentalgiana]|eukprot:GBG32489.1 Zinc phosphodiesterase ELAC protein 1 [Hondaea fermentalgiana]
MFSGWTWLFDCGEETQSQIHKGSSVRLAGVTRIYITHLHGDHFFGLPSILCAISEVKAPSDAQKLKLSRDKDKDVPIEIFGPPNLRLALRTMLLASGVVLPFRYVVTELHPKGAKTPSPASDLVNGVLHPSEILGKNLTSNDNFVWESVPTHCTPHPKDVSAVATVKAAMIRHSCNVTCIGYVVEEKSYSGSLDGQRAKEILRQPENQEYLIGIGVREPLRSLRYLKGGFELKLPTGILRPSDVVGPDKPGRKIVILGDTCDASNIAGIAANADMILHEATNAYLPELGLNGLLDSVDEWQTILRTLQHGHSTPQMAGKFAQAIGAKSLVMTHFSSRYPGMIPDRLKVTREMVEVHDAIRNAALETFKSGDAYLANDQEVFSVLGCWHESRVKDPTKVIKSSYRGFLRTARKIFASTDEQIVDFTLQPQGYRPSCKDMRNAYSCASKVMPPSFVSTEKFSNGPHYSEEFEMDEDEEDDEEMEDLEDNNQESEGDIADMAATSEKDASAPRDFDDGDLDDGDLDDDIGDDTEAGGGGSEHTEDASDLDKTSDLFQDGSCENRPLSRSEASAAAKEAVKPYEKVLRRKRLFGARIIYPNSKAT